VSPKRGSSWRPCECCGSRHDNRGSRGDLAGVGLSAGSGAVGQLQAGVARHVDTRDARGFGTAILHASTTALVAITAKSWAERASGGSPVAVLPGLLAAIVLHSAYNHLLVHPLLAATLLMLVMPSIVLFVFGRSERATREWVGDGLDLDVELLNLVTSSYFGATRLGRYLNELKTRFPGPIVADMFCLLQLDLELSIRAKGMLLAREQGLEIPMDDSIRARLDERAYLHKSIGPTGLLALRPLQVTNDRDDWLRYLLKQR
jgi:hypothetical protein